MTVVTFVLCEARRSMALLVFLGFMMCISSVAGQEISTSDLVKGVIARSEQVFSGEIYYRQRIGGAGNVADGGDKTSRVLFSGSSWRLSTTRDASTIPVSKSKAKLPDMGHIDMAVSIEQVQLSHRGKFVKYSQTPREKGLIRNAATIVGEKPINYSNPSPPVFAGSLWYDSTRQFLKSNVGSAVRGEVVEVNGVKAITLEWIVSNPRAQPAFHSVNELTQNGGKLRLYVSPELGFALPRIEYVGKEGDVAVTFDSLDFKSYSGIFLPTQCSVQYRNKNTKNDDGYFNKNDIIEVKRLNEVIPDSEFAVDLPSGTIVVDSQSGDRGTAFVIRDKGMSTSDLRDVIQVHQQPLWRRTMLWAVAFGVAIGILAILVIAKTRNGLFRWRRS